LAKKGLAARIIRITVLIAACLNGPTVAARLLISSTQPLHLGDCIIGYRAGAFELHRLELFSIRAALEPVVREVPVGHIGFWTMICLPWAIPLAALLVVGVLRLRETATTRSA
jgi:hypothetical protein